MRFITRNDNQTLADPVQELIARLRQQGITDERVLAVMTDIPRDLFVPADQRQLAWENTALGIAHGQTISQPFVVALMTASLELTPHDRVLEIGTGSGYQAAILSRLAREVITIERIPDLAATAVRRFEELDIRNIQTITGDGSLGWSSGAPFDAIIVTAAAQHLPEQLVAQLSEDRGRMVIPLGPPDDERLTLFQMNDGELSRIDLGGVRFVPLIRNHNGK